MHESLATALDLFKDSRSAVVELWGIYSSIALALLAFVLGKDTPLSGRKKFTLAAGFLLFAGTNVISLWQQQSVCFAAVQTIRSLLAVTPPIVDTEHSNLLRTLNASPAYAVAGLQMSFSVLTLGEIYLAHRREHALTHRGDPNKLGHRP